MTERQMHFRVGLLALLSLGITAVLIVQFGELRKLWEPTYPMVVHFPKLSNVYAGTPVRTNGIDIGEVTAVTLDPAGGVRVDLAILEQHAMPAGTEISIAQGLLGDASLDVMPGRGKPLPPGSRIEGTPFANPLEAVERLEVQVSGALASFQATSEEWRNVGQNINSLVETNRGNFDTVVERAAESLHQFSLAMTSLSNSAKQAGDLVGDPQNQENIRQTLAAMPAMVADAREAMAALRLATVKADENLTNLSAITGPLASRSASVVNKLDSTLTHLDQITGEMAEFSQLINSEEGALRQFVSNPALYQNLERSAETLAVLMTNLEPVLRDLRIFSDKVARRPELMGVGGALAPSDGTKPPVPSGVSPVGFSTPATSESLPVPGSTVRVPGSSQRR